MSNKASSEAGSEIRTKKQSQKTIAKNNRKKNNEISAKKSNKTNTKKHYTHAIYSKLFFSAKASAHGYSAFHFSCFYHSLRKAFKTPVFI